MAAKFYTTVQNDTFDAIAYRLWGDEHQAPRLLAANPAHMDALLFAAGIELQVPDYVPKAQTAQNLPPWYGA